MSGFIEKRRLYNRAAKTPDNKFKFMSGGF